MYSQCRQMVNCWGPMTEHVHGDRAVVDLNGKMRISQARDDGQEPENPYRLEHLHLLDAIWNDKPYNEGWIGADSSMTSIIGREASYSGQVIRWDELVAKAPDVFPKDLTWETEPPVMPDEQGRYDHLVPIPGFYKPY
ncbi:hypothetical protein V7x_01420 [Crateriforma conspicua]|uniref:Gfo/Idh/MocA-like oxidoreductase bacterial type C-terminal domain-containing protein n=3 Tax=Crateriforma TaxID=2714592 RepID=A0A5C6FSV9_9PLAN|nr:hypothetical protein V7x_01420 [Crateriforma conspicua]